MQLRVDGFDKGARIPDKYTCQGDNVQPRIEIGSLPPGTKSVALILDDPDSFAGEWNHWLLWNIPPFTTVLKQGEFPEDAVQGTTSFESVGYGGPCPKKGEHRYFFKGYALDTMLDLPAETKKSDLETAMQGHIKDETEVFGVYEILETQERVGEAMDFKEFISEPKELES